MEKLKKLPQLYDSLDNILENWYNEDGIDEKIKFHTIIIALNTILVFEKAENDLILYIYDAAGYAVGMQYRASSYAADVWDVYWFDRNMFGDIVAVYDQEGVKLASYTYNAWGVPTVSYSNGGASTTAAKNNLRYRGYFYDADLGMYYLQSRYYDAKVCRFINADGYISTGQGLLGYNMFAYCGNNPVNRTDHTGEAWYHWFLLAIVDPVTANLVATINKAVDLGMMAVANNQLQEQYTKDEAEDEIKKLSVSDVNFYNNNVELVDSKDVNSRYNRLKTSMILTRTVNDDGSQITNRSAFDISAEILGHNMMYKEEPTLQTKDANIDYVLTDNAAKTLFGTLVLVFFGFI